MDLCLPRHHGWLLAAHWSNGSGWLRVFGRGLSAADRSRHPALFSERNGLVRVWRVGRWAVRWLAAARKGQLTRRYVGGGALDIRTEVMTKTIHTYDNVERTPSIPVTLDDGAVMSFTIETRSVKVRLPDGSIALHAQMTFTPDADRSDEERKGIWDTNKE